MGFFRRLIPETAIRWIIGIICIIAFLVALFAAGMAVYGAIAGISYSEAWANLIEAIRDAIYGSKSADKEVSKSVWELLIA